MATPTPPPPPYTPLPTLPADALTELSTRITNIDSHVAHLTNDLPDLNAGVVISVEDLYERNSHRRDDISALRDEISKLRDEISKLPQLYRSITDEASKFERSREVEKMREREKSLEGRLEIRMEEVRAETRREVRRERKEREKTRAEIKAEMKEREESLENRLEKVEAKERWLETLIIETRAEIGAELTCVEKRLGAKIDERQKRAWRTVFGFRSLKKGG